MVDLTGIKNIIFDYGGVIINTNTRLTINAFKELGFFKVEDYICQSNNSDLLVKMEKGQMSDNVFRDGIRKVSNLKLTDEQIDFAWNAILLDMSADKIKLLEKLRKKYKIFLLSNTNVIHYKKFLKDLQQKFGYLNFNKLFEKAWFSFQLGMVKPDAEIYNYVLTDASLLPKETLFIDDSAINIKGAKKTGIKTYLLNNEDILEAFKNYEE